MLISGCAKFIFLRLVKSKMFWALESVSYAFRSLEFYAFRGLKLHDLLAVEPDISNSLIRVSKLQMTLSHIRPPFTFSIYLPTVQLNIVIQYTQRFRILGCEISRYTCSLCASLEMKNYAYYIIKPRVCDWVCPFKLLKPTDDLHDDCRPCKDFDVGE